MSTNFPTSLDTFPAAATLAAQSLFTTPHSTLHGNLGDSVAALEAKVGIDASAVTTSLDYKVQKLLPGPSQGRLTLTTGVPVTTADVTAAGTVYFTPYKGNGISLYSVSTTKWLRYSFAEISVSLAGLTLNVPTDVFAYWTGSAVALELVNWSNGTTRATAIALQDGTYTKSGDATRLYLGTVCGSGAGTCEDSLLRRFVYNYYHQEDRTLSIHESASSWVYTTAVFRPMNNSTGNRVQLVSGTGEDMSEFWESTLSTQTVTIANNYPGIGFDSTSDPGASDFFIPTYALGVQFPGFAYKKGYLSAGYHYIQALESGGGVGTTTWTGASFSGITGRCRG